MSVSPRPRFVLPEGAGPGLLLIAAAAVALVLANSPLAPAYHHTLSAPLGPLSVHGWIDDALMALFFLGIGLEVKREWTGGRLATPADRVLPIAAAVGGMAVPALVYLAVAGAVPGLARGWAIPAATDIAFALAVLALIGRARVPAALALFLSTLAIADDVGAVAIIAIVYTPAIDPAALAAAALVTGAMALAATRGITRLAPYLLLGALLWIALFRAGIHPTIAGVVTAFLIPPGPRAAGRLEGALHPWTAFAIVPLFGLANAGVWLGGGVAALLAPLPLAIAAGLFVGKQAGVFGAVRIAVALGVARRPAGASWRQVHGVAVLAGVGFTMSLFIGTLAFPDPALAAAVRLGVLAGSALSALTGAALLMMAAPRQE